MQLSRWLQFFCAQFLAVISMALIHIRKKSSRRSKDWQSKLEFMALGAEVRGDNSWKHQLSSKIVIRFLYKAVASTGFNALQGGVFSGITLVRL